MVSFFANLSTHVTVMRNAHLRADYQELARQAHQMAGTAGAYGFPRIGRVAAEVDALAGNQENPEVIANSIKKFSNLCDAATHGMAH